MPYRDETTGTLTYIKLLILAKLFRGGFMLGVKMQRLGEHTPQSPIHGRIHKETHEIPSSKSQRQIRITIYKNEAAVEAGKRGEKSAVHIHWYGGGWMLPHAPSQTLPLFTIIFSSPRFSSYPLTIIDATYALSPEHPCPAELEDARDVYSHVLAHPAIWEKERVTFSGSSSGGAIALGLAAALGNETRQDSNGKTEQGEGWMHPVKGIVVYYPMTNWVGIAERNTAFLASIQTQDHPSMMPNFLLDTITAAHFFSPTGAAPSAEEEAARKNALQHTPIVSPALADVVDFPPRVAIWTAEWDVMHIDADGLRERLQTRRRDGGDGSGDVETSGSMVKGVGHGWDLAVCEGQIGWEESVEAHQDLVKTIAWAGGLNVE